MKQYRIVCNEIEFDFHDEYGAELTIQILERFEIPYRLYKLEE